MPRKNRKDKVYDNSTHHVLQRGINRMGVFRQATDYEKFINLTKRYLTQYRVNIYNYCPMSTHFHFSIYVKESGHLSKFMHSLLLAYSAYFRHRYNYTGYLWQGRFKNLLIENDAYLLECARYIERNPVRAKIVKDPSQYPWSSYQHYATGIKDELITPNPLFETLGKTPQERRSNYRKYILEERPYEKVLDDVFRI